MYFEFLDFCENNGSSHKSKSPEKTSDGVHILNKVTGSSPVILL